MTADHVISNDETYGFKGEWNALVVKDVFTQFRYFYPSARQDADSCVRAFQHFTKPDDHVGIFYSDNSGEIAAAVKSMGWRHVLSQPYVSQSPGVIEREIRTILEGARANLFQSGLPVELWPLAAQHHAFALNVTIPDDKDKSPWALRFGDEFPDAKIPFGAKLSYWINRQRVDSKQSKFLPTSDVGIFVGYHCRTSCGRVTLIPSASSSMSSVCLMRRLFFPQSKLLPTTNRVLRTNWNMSRSHICSLAKQLCRRRF